MDAEPDYLSSGDYIDSAHPAVIEFARQTVGGERDPLKQALALYLAVRDRIAYEPYLDYTDMGTYRASDVLALGRGFCVGKAALLAAAARAVGIPARTGYADVQNHITSKRLQDLVQTNIFYWHSYTDLKLEGRWVKATPAFDAALCERAGLVPLEFDGRTDSLFQPFDALGRKRMEYLAQRGTYADVPADEILASFRRHYPALIAVGIPEGDFAAEAHGAE